MTLRKIQKLQLVWLVLGLGFNAASYWQINAGHAALSSTDAISGGIFMAVCGIIIFAGLKGATKVYKFIIPILTLSLGYSGWFLHINAYLHDSTLPDYASFVSWLLVILINTYGLITLLAGTWLAWRWKYLKNKSLFIVCLFHQGKRTIYIVNHDRKPDYSV